MFATFSGQIIKGEAKFLLGKKNLLHMNWNILELQQEEWLNVQEEPKWSKAAIARKHEKVQTIDIQGAGRGRFGKEVPFQLHFMATVFNNLKYRCVRFILKFLGKKKNNKQ